MACWEIENGFYVVATPDDDVYVERLYGMSIDTVAVRRSAVPWPLPPGIGRQACYRFAVVPDDARVAGFMQDAEVAGILGGGRKSHRQPQGSGRPSRASNVSDTGVRGQVTSPMRGLGGGQQK